MSCQMRVAPSVSGGLDRCLPLQELALPWVSFIMIDDTLLFPRRAHLRRHNDTRRPMLRPGTRL